MSIETHHGTLKSCTVGFFVSIVLTVAAYLVVVKELASGGTMMLIIGGLGACQALVQFIIFLHLGKETKPRWSLIVFLFMLLVTAILIFGSLWIMYNLDYRMMGSL